jgi:hypothetical protein
MGRKKKEQILAYNDDLPIQKKELNKQVWILNIALFIVAAVLLALAIAEPGRGLDMIAGVVFVFVLVKIGIDGYSHLR